jgi:hypothetical protein
MPSGKKTQSVFRQATMRDARTTSWTCCELSHLRAIRIHYENLLPPGVGSELIERHLLPPGDATHYCEIELFRPPEHALNPGFREIAAIRSYRVYATVKRPYTDGEQFGSAHSFAAP